MLPIERPTSQRQMTHAYGMTSEEASWATERLERQQWAHADVLAFKDIANAAQATESPTADVRIAVTPEWRSLAQEAISYRMKWLERGSGYVYDDEPPPDWLDRLASTGSHTEWNVDLPNAADGTWDVRVSESGTEVYWFGHYVKPRDWAYRQKFPALRFDIRGYLIEADPHFLQNRLGLGGGKSSLSRFASAVAEALDGFMEERQFQLDRISEARIRREAKALVRAFRILNGRAREITIPYWLHREIERYGNREAIPQPATTIAEFLGQIQVVGIGSDQLCLMTASGQAIHITGDAELVRDKDSLALWPKPDDWKSVANLRGIKIDEISREPNGSVLMATDDEMYILVRDANDFHLSGANPSESERASEDAMPATKGP